MRLIPSNRLYLLKAIFYPVAGVFQPILLPHVSLWISGTLGAALILLGVRYAVLYLDLGPRPSRRERSRANGC